MTEKLEEWNRDPEAQFKVFVRSADFVATGRRYNRPAEPDPEAKLADRSILVYESMFKKYCLWLKRKNKRFADVTADDVRSFLSSAGANSSIYRRYLRLIERCFDHLEVNANPARRATYEATRMKEIKNDGKTVVLTDEQFTRFLAALPLHQVKYPRGGLLNGWKRRRDRAMQLTMLCAGLRVSGVIGLLLTEVPRQPDLDGSLRLRITPTEKHSTSYPHVAPLNSLAVTELLAWIDERVSLPIPGERVFPADAEGGALSHATVYRQVNKTFKRAGIDVQRSGGRTLRNTRAVQDIRAGVPLEDLANNLGLAGPDSVETYRVASKRNES